MTLRTRLLAFVLLFGIFGCRQHITTADVSKLNGYWEIEKVVFPDGNKKEYKINETIDFFSVRNNKGLRKKVKPQFDGSYIENGDSETIDVSFKDGKALIDYSTPYAKWSEEILELTDKNFVIKNDRNMEYHYKKAVPFSIK